jgi:hypothetical protein
VDKLVVAINGIPLARSPAPPRRPTTLPSLPGCAASCLPPALIPLPAVARRHPNRKRQTAQYPAGSGFRGLLLLQLPNPAFAKLDEAKGATQENGRVHPHSSGQLRRPLLLTPLR